MWFWKSGWFPDRLRSFSVLALVPVLLPISSRIFRSYHDLSLFCLRRPFAKCFAWLSQLLGVSSRYCFPVTLKLAGLALLFRLGVSIQAQPRVMFHRFFQKKYVVVWPFLKIVRYSNCQFLHSCFIRFAPVRRYWLLETLRSFSSLIVRRSVELAMSNPGQVPD